MRNWILSLSILTLHSSTTFAQSSRHSLSIGINPLSVAEPFASIGPFVGVHLSSRIECWSEISFYYTNLYKLNNWTGLSGFRFIFQPRYYPGRTREFFIAPEFRLKQYNYTGHNKNFINSDTQDTLKGINYSARQSLPGGALVVGWHHQLFNHKSVFVEITAGIGVRERNITYRNIPAGYEYELVQGGFGLKPHYDWNKDSAPYIPLGIRLCWTLK